MTYIKIAKANLYGYVFIVSMTLLLKTGIIDSYAYPDTKSGL